MKLGLRMLEGVMVLVLFLAKSCLLLVTGSGAWWCLVTSAWSW